MKFYRVEDAKDFLIFLRNNEKLNSKVVVPRIMKDR
jgi:hypothetical protein